MIHYIVMPGLKYRPDIADEAYVVITKICAHFNIQKKEIYSASRRSRVSNVRFMCMKILFTNLGMTKSAIGRIFNRDRATVIYCIKKYGDLKFSDAEFSRQAILLESKL